MNYPQWVTLQIVLVMALWMLLIGVLGMRRISKHRARRYYALLGAGLIASLVQSFFILPFIY